ncbi:hypothetical protein B0H14DRAFT_3906012 [Mycena olivaceomarginata]|nr:hypothetical protein B0H14DRAFT_3906012 [Mycena olivaceomarginata]
MSENSEGEQDDMSRFGVSFIIAGSLFARRAANSPSANSAPWPEWDCPAWARHHFTRTMPKRGHPMGYRTWVFRGRPTRAMAGIAWHYYEYLVFVGPWDGLIGLVMRPHVDTTLSQHDRTLGLSTFFLSVYLIGRDTFEGTWQMVAQEALGPSWGGSICLARARNSHTFDAVIARYSVPLVPVYARLRHRPNALSITANVLYRSIPGSALWCATGAFYSIPALGDSIDSKSPSNVVWRPELQCLQPVPSLVDVFGPCDTTPLLRTWTGVPSSARELLPHPPLAQVGRHLVQVTLAPVVFCVV